MSSRVCQTDGVHELELSLDSFNISTLTFGFTKSFFSLTIVVLQLNDYGVLLIYAMSPTMNPISPANCGRKGTIQMYAYAWTVAFTLVVFWTLSWQLAPTRPIRNHTPATTLRSRTWTSVCAFTDISLLVSLGVDVTHLSSSLDSGSRAESFSCRTCGGTAIGLSA